jgi:hypothetical protein
MLTVVFALFCDCRRERLEIFDELEEFHLLQAHYCVVVASKLASTPAARALALGDVKP